MAVRSKCFVRGHVIGTGVAGVFYTVPAGRTARVTAIWLANGGGVAQQTSLYLTPHIGTTDLIWAGNVPGSGALVLPGPLVMEPGINILGTCSLGNVAVSMYGSLLLGAPA